MSNYDDVTYAMGDLEGGIDELLSTEVNGLLGQIDEVQTQFGKVERELSYLEDDFEELERFREIGDINDVEEISEKVADLEEDLETAKAALADDKVRVELENLKVYHENQRNVIHALLRKVREVHKSLSEAEIVQVMNEANPCGQ
jgi:chromosome segregation ATPase